MGISLGILGAGVFVQNFIPLFQSHPLVDSVALCEHKPNRLAETAKKHNISRTFESYEQMLASDIQAVAIFTQHWMHAPQAMQALKAGKDVYSAVPAAASIEELTALVRLVESSGRIYMMGETSAYYAEAILCRERHQRGEFGNIVYAQAEYMHDWDHGLYEAALNRGGPHWRKDTRYWCPMSYPTHSIGMVLSVTRTWATHVSCIGIHDTKAEDHDIHAPDGPNPFSNECALFHMSDGSAMRINEMRRIGHPGAERMALFGTEGCFERTSDARLWTTRTGVERLDQTFASDHPHDMARRARLPDGYRNDAGHGGSHAFLADDFIKACAWRLQPPVNAWQAARYLMPGLIAHTSALQGGKQLEIPDLGAGPAVDLLAFERQAVTV